MIMKAVLKSGTAFFFVVRLSRKTAGRFPEIGKSSRKTAGGYVY